jgi:hypothetical protein
VEAAPRCEGPRGIDWRGENTVAEGKQCDGWAWMRLQGAWEPLQDKVTVSHAGYNSAVDVMYDALTRTDVRAHRHAVAFGATEAALGSGGGADAVDGRGRGWMMFVRRRLCRRRRTHTRTT